MPRQNLVHIIILALLLGLATVSSLTRYLLAFVSVLALILVRVGQLKEPGQKFLLRIFIISLILRSVFVILLHLQPYQPIQGMFFPDAASYHRWAVKIAGLWHQSHYPPLWTDSWLGTLHTGYFRIVAALYWALGTHVIFPIILNILLSSLVPLILFFLANEFWGEKEARYAALISALHPSFWFWSAFLLKDIVHLFFFLAAFFCLFLLIKQFNPFYLFVSLFCLFILFVLRIYGLAVLVVSFLVYLLLWGKRGWLLAGLGIVAVLYLLLRQFLIIAGIPIIKEIEGQMIFSFLNLLPDAYWSLANVYKEFAIGIPRFFLSPYAWVFAPYLDVNYFLYPGQWFLYLFIIPLALCGIYHVFKHDHREAFLLIFPVILNCYLFLLVYKGSVPRQRLHLEALLIVLAACGLNQRIKKNIVLIYYILLFLFIAAHVTTVWIMPRL